MKKETKNAIVLGNLLDGQPCTIDVPRLIESRLVVTAQSGAGKSWALRRILEQTHGAVQHLVIDPEGEFFTLREKYDYVLARANGEGDCLAHPKSAGLLATSLLELGVSAIMDIYELKPRDRILFVKNFIEALNNAPKRLHHPTLIVIDEAPMFVPQEGDAESAEAIWTLATQGRKRGFCLIPAAARISMIHKHAISAIGNYLVGRSTLDIDVKRAAGILGFSGNEDKTSIHRLQDGEFYAYGSAISREVQRMKVGSVVTTHPRAGTVPPPSPTPSAIRAVMEKLSAIPKEAERKLASEAELRQRVAELERELARKIPAFDAAAIAKASADGASGAARIFRTQKQEAIHRVKGALDLLEHELLWLEMDAPVPQAQTQPPPRPPAALPVVKRSHPAAANNSGSSAGSLKAPERRILTVLAQRPEGVETDRLAMLSGYTVNGHFNNTMGGLRTRGLISPPRVTPITITEEGLQELGHFEPLPTGHELQRYWLQKLSQPEQRILQVLLDRYPRPIETEDLARESGYTVNGHFNNTMGCLRTKGLISPPRQPITASKDFFEG